MKVEIASLPAHQNPVDAVVIGIYEGSTLTGAAQDIDNATSGLLTRLIEHGEISNEALSVSFILGPPGISARQVVVVGMGVKPTTSDTAALYRAAGKAAKRLATKKRESVAFYLEGSRCDAGICGAMNGCVGQDLYRKERNLHPFDVLQWATDDEEDIQIGQILGDAVQLTRRLVNAPANEIYPESLATECQKIGNECRLDVEVWDESRLESEKCGALLAVARGSDRAARMVIMRYNGGEEGQAPLGLVGKGVTFDSGGLSLKPSEAMTDMKCDMAGAATVIGAMQAIARLKLPVNVIGLVGCVENMVSGRSYRLGDVITARNGKTIEVLNTDAEGRLVLADVLHVAVTNGCGKLVDLATLTGACVVALGTQVTGLMTNNEAWSDSVLQASRYCGEDAWQLPMFDQYAKQIKSQVADLKNIGDGRWGGAITAAKFLEEFVDDKPWVHLDIAGPSFNDKPLDWLDGGASGCFVRTLVEIARKYNG